MALTIGGAPDQRPALAQAREALERGEGAQAVTLVNRALREPGLTREDSLLLRCALAEAWLLQDELKHAADALGRPPDELRERLEPARISALWRLHGRITAARGEPSRAIAQLGKALKAAERAHDSLAIGLAHYELGLCYRRVGDTAIVREHLNKAASALHAAGDRRHLALVHSLSGVVLATQDGRIDEAMAALRQAERLAALARANDVVAIVCNNQANVALLQNRHEQALALAERSVSLQAETGSPHGLGVSLASLGQICVRAGKLERAEQVLRRALAVQSAVQFLRETRGAVYDTLTQIHLIRGEYDLASTCLLQARDAYGEYGTQTSKWYEWSIRVLEARLALRRGRLDEALALATETAQSPAAPPADALQAALIASEAVLVAGRVTEAAERIAALGHRLQPAGMPSLWGEYLRLRGRLHAREGRTTEAYHDLGQSVSVFELFGERYEAGLSYLALGGLAADAGARSRATRYLADAAASFEALGAGPDLAAARAALARVPGQFVPVPAPEVVKMGAVGAVPAGLGVVDGDTIPYLPAALEKKKDNQKNWLTSDPEIKCYLPGVPRANYMPYPFQIFQSKDYVFIAYEYAGAVRNVYMKDPGAPPADSWMGQSVGKWEGDTLVITVTGFNDSTWFDRAGNHHSDSLKVTERWTPKGPDHLWYEATIEDPKTFSRPWKISMPLYRRVESNAQLMQFKCVEFVEELMYGELRKKSTQPAPPPKE